MYGTYTDACYVCLQEFSENPGRQWLDGLLQSPTDDEQVPSSTSSHGFVDVFRWLHPTASEAYTNWCTVTGARATNYGCRLDYIIADVGLVPSFVSCDILAEVEGSDHCPVRAELDLHISAARKCPPLCTKYLPQFAGRQQTLATFFSKERQSSSQTEIECESQCSSLEQSSLVSESLPSPLQTAEFSAQSVKRRVDTQSTDVFSDRHSNNKKLKLSDHKQTILLTFFGKHSLPSSHCEEPSSQSAASNTSSSSSLTEAVNNQQNDILSQELLDADSKLPNGHTASKWKTLLKGPPQPPLCKGHKEPCVLRTVKKDGPNKGKQFWVCCKPEGPKNNPEARCDSFIWVTSRK